MRTLSTSLIVFVAALGGTAVSAGEAPASPSDVIVVGGVLHWTDNSENEEGFEITSRVYGFDGAAERVNTYRVSADVTQFPLPQEASISCDAGLPSGDWAVRAFIGGVYSASDGYGVTAECDLAPGSSPVLPVAGSGPDARSTREALLGAVVLLAVAVAGLTVATLHRSRGNRLR